MYLAAALANSSIAEVSAGRRAPKEAHSNPCVTHNAVHVNSCAHVVVGLSIDPVVEVVFEVVVSNMRNGSVMWRALSLSRRHSVRCCGCRRLVGSTKGSIYMLMEANSRFTYSRSHSL